MRLDRDFALVVVAAALEWGLLGSGCTSPPSPPPAPIDTGPFPANQPASAVLSELGVCFDGGLPQLEQLHANANRPAWVDCVFTVGSTVQGCAVPCSPPSH
jgi:hypothetical protein